MSSGLDDLSLFELFRMEAEEQVRVLQAELLQLESNAATPARLEALMRASHSLKGAARIVGLDPIVKLTHAMEDRFVVAQAGAALDAGDVDRMLAATDWLAKLQATPEANAAQWLEENATAIESFALSFTQPATDTPTAVEAATEPTPLHPAPPPPKPSEPEPDEDEEPAVFGTREATQRRTRERNVRISSERFDQMLSLASATLVSASQMAEASDDLESTRRGMARSLHAILEPSTLPRERSAAQRELAQAMELLAGQIADLDAIARGNERTSGRLYRSVLAGRLRPFAEGIGGMQRLVRDTARDLGKQVKVEILGERTRVDRDILEKLEAPLSHLVTNAIDHGIEAPATRTAAGKPAEATLRVNASHENGRLVITVRDDGCGINREALRSTIIRRGFVTPETAAGLSDAELLEFLFLPGFSTRDVVSTVSGRGVGLNVVQSMVQEAGGAVVVTSSEGDGTTFRLTLPITRSVIKAMTVQAEGELFAVPLVRIDRVLQSEATLKDDGSAIAEHDGKQMRVVPLASLLGFPTRALPPGPVPMVVAHGVAFVVDRIVDEVELPVRRIDARLGKIPGISAASLDEKGVPLLILDMDDLLQSANGHVTAAASSTSSIGAPHILVADDSHTVREIERRLLVKAGYNVTTAQNGLEAWNLLRLNEYDLLISDVDMPQMNGIELVGKVRENPRLARLPIIILSYKDREEDRRRGLDAGADFYLTKGDFENDRFRQAVVDLIGAADMLDNPGARA